MPTDSAGELSGEGFTRVENYEQIYRRIASGIPAPARARPDVAAEGEEVDLVVSAQDGEATTDTRTVAGLSASSLEVSGGYGYAYSAEGESLQVINEVTGARTQEINLYDCATLGGRAFCVLYGEDTLAVLYVSNEGAYRQSGDYALSAWAAPRSMVLLFDATEPARIVFERAIGIVGVPVAVYASGDVLVVATRHKVVPDVYDNGAWKLDGKSVEDVRGYADALALRANDAVAYVPSFYDDGELAPLLPEQIYLSGWGDATVATVVASFTLSGRSAASLFALYDPGPPQASTGAGEGTGGQVVPDGFVFDYVVDVQGAPAIASISVPIGTVGTLEGIGQVSWTDKGA
jgi:hypothetical protein